LHLTGAGKTTIRGCSDEAQSSYAGKRPPDTCQVGQKSRDFELHDFADGKNVQTADFAATQRHIDDRHGQLQTASVNRRFDLNCSPIRP
jgi:hypothetical protein